MKAVRPAFLAGGLLVLIGATASVFWLLNSAPEDYPVGADKITPAGSDLAPGAGGVDQTRPHRETERLSKATASLQHQVAALKIQLEDLTATVAELPQSAEIRAIAVEAAVSGVEPSPPDPEQVASALAQQDKQETRYLEDVETQLLNEQTDPQWSSQAAIDIEQALLSDRLSETAVVDIDCRFTLCRIELEHDSTVAYAKFQTVFPELIGDAMVHPALIYSDDYGGRNSTIMYLTREGYGLPEGAEIAQ